MNIEIKLINSCLNCEQEISINAQLCSVECLRELAECAKKAGVKSNYTLDDVDHGKEGQ